MTNQNQTQNQTQNQKPTSEQWLAKARELLEKGQKEAAKLALQAYMECEDE